MSGAETPEPLVRPIPHTDARAGELYRATCDHKPATDYAQVYRFGRAGSAFVDLQIVQRRMTDAGPYLVTNLARLSPKKARAFAAAILDAADDADGTVPLVFAPHAPPMPPNPDTL